MGAPSRTLLLAGAYYFVYFGAVGVYVPYVNLYFQAIGLSGSAIGVLASISPLVMLVASPLWGALGDRFHIHRRLLTIASLGPIVPVLLLPHVRYLGGLAVLVTVAAVFITPIIALIDSAVLDLIAGTRASFGSVRWAGAFGFTVCTALMGFALNRLPLESIFYAYAGLLLTGGLLALGLPARRQAWRESFRASLRQLLRQRALVLFLAGNFLVGATLQTSYSFFPLYLEALGGSPSLVGTAGAIGSLSEMPVLFFSGRLLGALGAGGTVLLGFSLFAVRWGLLAALPAPVPAVLTNLLHGFSFAPFLTGGVAFVEARTPPGLHATAQGVFNAVTFGLGAATGALAGGWLYDAVGPARLFAVCAGTVVLGIGCVLLAERQPRAQAAVP